MNRIRHATLAWALLLSLVASFYVGFWIPLQERANQNHERVASLTTRIAKLNELIHTKSQLRDEIDRMEQGMTEAGRGRIIKAKSDTLGNGDLQRRMQTIFAKHHVRQISNQPSSEQVSERFYRLEQTINVSGTLPAMHAVLFDLETGSPRVFIPKILLTTRSGLNSRRRNANIGINSAELTARLSVIAYMEVVE